MTTQKPESGGTPLARALNRRTPNTEDADSTTITEERRSGGGLASRSTTIQGQQTDLATPETAITFEDEHGRLTGEYGRPRPMEFWHAKQLGQTPPMELLKNVVARQLTGGQPQATTDDGDLQGTARDLADLTTDIYEGPHFQEKSLDNIITDAVNDLVDTAFAYWELLPSEGGEYPVAGFKPLPSLQVNHNIDEDTGELQESPAFYHVPHERQGNTVEVSGGDPTALDRDRVVVMREPLSSRSDSLYGESIATRVREWLDILTDVDAHQKRHYNDSQMPAGFLHFKGSIDDDRLIEIEQDIREAAGDPHELVTTTAEDDASWIPVGNSVVDLDAIQEQEWYFKLVFAAAGIPHSELNIIESSGFAKENPSLQRALYKNVTRPFMNAIFQPQNHQVLPRIAEGVGVDEVPFELGLERFDPVQEQIEREETLKEWTKKAVSLNELRGALGKDAHEIPMEIEGVEGDEDGRVNIADLPRYVVDLVLDDSPSVDLGALADDMEDS